MACLFRCIGNIPWWAWIILAVAAVVIALLTYFTGGIAGATIPLWLQALMSGLGSTVGATLLICVRGCTSR
jgi:RsiW-degrading membrane proteinase PrsW (M82 family)